MQIKEILTEEIVRELTNGEFDICVDSHFLDRTKDRRIPVKFSGQVLAKINRIKDEILEVAPPGQQFWIRDLAVHISLGLRRLSDKHGQLRVLLKTVVPGDPIGNLNPWVDIEE